MAKPEIRLKGFDGEWKPDIIGNIANVVGGGTPSTSITNYWNGGIQWFTPSEVGKSRYVSCSERNISKEGLDNSSAKIIPANSILLSSRATVGEASINTCKCCTNQGFQSLIPKNVDLDFLYTLIATIKRDIVRESSGSTFLEISANKVRNLSVTIPNLIEQKALGVYFKSLDSMIQGVTKKIASLKQMKQACLVSMFPQAGETTPRVRFKGFKGEWERKSFGDLYYQNVVKNDLSFGTDKIISVANMFFKTNSYISDQNYLRTYNIFRLGDIAFEGNKSKNFAHGRFVENTIGDGIVSHVFDVFSPKSDKHDLNYWKYAINNERIMGRILVRCTKASTMMTNLVAKDFLKEYILVPSYEEQIKIGSFFSSLDAQISLQEQRLEKLKQIKSACLDKMFV